MNDEKMLDIYQAVTGADNLSIGQATISVETGTRVEDYQILKTRIKDFKFEQGWLCYQSEVIRLTASDELPARDDKILNGELVNGHESLHIQQDGSGWWITRIVEGQGEPCLIKTQRYYINENEQACYHVYWKYLEQGYQLDSYRFVGFNSTQGAS